MVIDSNLLASLFRYLKGLTMHPDGGEQTIVSTNFGAYRRRERGRLCGLRARDVCRRVRRSVDSEI